MSVTVFVSVEERWPDFEISTDPEDEELAIWRLELDPEILVRWQAARMEYDRVQRQIETATKWAEKAS